MCCSACRMKYFWTPYVCMFTAFGVCSPDLWMTVFKWLKLKSIHPVVLVSMLVFVHEKQALKCHSELVSPQKVMSVEKSSA